MREQKHSTISKVMICQVGFLISPVMPEHSGQYWCTATYGDKTSEYGVSLNVLMQTRWVVCSIPTVLGKMGKLMPLTIITEAVTYL